MEDEWMFGFVIGVAVKIRDMRPIAQNAGTQKLKENEAMSNYQPTEPYVYQPEPMSSPDYPRIYALAGPGVPKEYKDKKYTKEEAKAALIEIKESKSLPSSRR